MATFSIQSATIRGDGRTLVLRFVSDSEPSATGAVRYLEGRRAGASISVTGQTGLRFIGARVASTIDRFKNGSYDHTTRTLTKTGHFATLKSPLPSTPMVQFHGQGAFEIASATADSITLTGVAVSPNAAEPTNITITNATWSSASGGRAVFTVGSNHGAIVGQNVTVSGVTPSGYNGTWAVVAVGSSTITVTMTVDPGTYTSGGTMGNPCLRMLHMDARNGTGVLWEAAFVLDSTVAWGDTGITVTADAGLLRDRHGNQTSAVSAYAVTNDSLAGADGWLHDDIRYPKLTVTAASWSGGTATLTVGSHTLAVGNLVTVTGITPSGFNVTRAAITAVTATTLSYAVADPGSAYVSGGTCNATVIIYVCPGHGGASDSNTFAQAQNPATAMATLAGATVLATANTRHGKGCTIACAEGTDLGVHTSATWRFGGESRSRNMVVTSFDATSLGIGTAGQRPLYKITGNGVTHGTATGGGSPIPINHCIFDRLKVGSTSVVAGGNLFRFRINYDGVTCFDCDFDQVQPTNQIDEINGTDWLATRHAYVRCIFRNTFNTAGHSQGIFNDGTDSLLVSQCVFNKSGKKNLAGSASDGFSHPVYNEERSVFPIVWGCFFFRGGGSGVQLRPGGACALNISEECTQAGFIGGDGGSIRRNFVCRGVDAGTTAFSGMTYTHSTRKITGSGINTSLAAGSCICVDGGTGLASGHLIYAKVAATASGEVTLAGDGLGVALDGATNVSGVKLVATARGNGFQFISGSSAANDSYRYNHGSVMDNNVIAQMDALVASPNAMLIDSKAWYKNADEYLRHNNTSYLGGEFGDSTTDATKPTILTDSRNLSFQTGSAATTPRAQAHATSFASWSHYVGDGCTFLSGATPIRVVSTNVSLASYRTTSGQHADSRDSATLTFADPTRTTVSYFASLGVATTLHEAIDLLVNRAPGTWGVAYDGARAAEYLIRGYAEPTGKALLGEQLGSFEGAYITDPAYFGLRYAPGAASVTAAAGPRWSTFNDEAETFLADDVGATAVFDDNTGVSALETGGKLRVTTFDTPDLVGESITSITVNVRLKWEPSLLTPLLLLKAEFDLNGTVFATIADPSSSSDPLGDIAVPGGGGGGVTASKYHSFTTVSITITDPAILGVLTNYFGNATLGVTLTPRGLSSSSSRHAATLHVDGVWLSDVATEATAGTARLNRLNRMNRLARV